MHGANVKLGTSASMKTRRTSGRTFAVFAALLVLPWARPQALGAEALLAKVLQSAAGGTSDGTWVNRFAEYDRLLDNLTAARAKAGVKNTATAFGLLLDIVEKHLDELPQAKPRGKAQEAPQ